MASRAEAYDILLSSFLRRFLSRPDTSNTIVFLRADHGLQGGLTTTDYSIQQEALRPWTELIVPKTLEGMSLDILFNNQQQLATGFDIYHTITESIVGGVESLAPPIPKWSLHLWKTAIPPSRTCAEAGVREEYCRLESQRAYTAPNLGTCNLAEEEQSLVCPHHEDSFQSQMSSEVSAAFHTMNNIQTEACLVDSTSIPQPPLLQSLAKVWTTIDVDDGKAFLCGPDCKAPPSLQAATLAALIHDLGSSRTLNVCMDGFGNGHAAALFLYASATLRLHIFDKMAHSHQVSTFQTLERNYGSARLSLHASDEPNEDFFPKILSPTNGMHVSYNTSNHTNKASHGSLSCDFIFGTNHTLAMVKSAPCGILVVSGARTSLRNTQIYFGKNTSQWSQLRKDGCLKDMTCFEEDPTMLTLKGANKTMEVTQKWCIGVTTGACQTAFRKTGASSGQNKKELEDHCNSPVAQLTRQNVALDCLCPSHKIQNLPSPITPPESVSSKARRRLPDSARKNAA